MCRLRNMKKYLFLIALWFTFLIPDLAQAANCFWVGGTGSWDGTNTGGGGTGGRKWASTSGDVGNANCAGSGTGGSPGTADTATFDAASGGGVVTATSALNGTTIFSITAGAFTGTLDMTGVSSMTMTSMSLSGTGARKFSINGPTFTFTNAGAGNTFDLSTTTNLDPTSNTAANFVFTANTAQTRTFNGGGRTYGTLTVSSNSSRGIFATVGANTFAGLSLAAGTVWLPPQSVTTTISSAFTLSGSSSLPITIGTFGTNVATISVATGTSTLDFGTLQGITATGGGTFNATNAFDGGRNTGWSITPPSGGGGGGRIIGG